MLMTVTEPHAVIKTNFTLKNYREWSVFSQWVNKIIFTGLVIEFSSDSNSVSWWFTKQSLQPIIN